jgi:phenylpropionate dioxygenase-like ring-hydroxylating dioxygenase large terminal subunit
MNSAFPMHEVDGDEIALIKREIAANAARPVEQATTLPREAFLSPEFYQLEGDAVLKAGWLPLGHVSQLAEKGSYFAVDLMSEPLLVIRGNDEEIRVLSRSCPHRGTDIMHKCLGIPRSGKAQRLLCPYHRWSFGLQGELRGAPQMERSEGFNKEDWSLGAFRSAVWEGFIFVNLDGRAPELSDLYGDFQKRIASWRCAEMELIYEREWEGAFNWKIMVENWAECYHHIGTHSKTLQATWPAQDVVIVDEHPNFMHTELVYSESAMKSIENGESYFVFPPIPDIPFGGKVEFWIFLGYPCFLLAVLKDCVLWLRVVPNSVESCTILTTILVPKVTTKVDNFVELKAKMEEIFVGFHAEDMLINVAVHEGLKSSKAVTGRLSHIESPIWMFHKYLARQLQSVA